MDKLINGKSNIERIVSIEVKDGSAEIFQQSETGVITSQFVANKFWLLSNRKINPAFKKLNGNLHYQYGRQFTERDEFLKYRNIYRNQKEDIYSIFNPKDAVQVKDGFVYYRGLKPKDISVLSFDIETTGLNDEDKNAFVVMISTTYRDSKGSILKKLFSYDEYENQGKMIDAFCSHVRDTNPSILLGFNILQFDLKYLNTIAKKNNTRLILGRDGSEIKFNSYDTKFRVDGNRDLEFKNSYVYGREIIDMYFVAQKMDVSKKLESYGLKKIIDQLKLGKPNRTFYDASQIRFNFKNPVELKKIKEYCIDDSDDSITLYDYFIPALFYWCQVVPKSFQDLCLSATGTQINSIMVRSYLQEGHSLPKADEVKRFEGAISYGAPGIYDNCVRWDVSSLYPSVIIAFDVHDPDKDPNGNFLKLVKTLTKERLNNKKLAKETGERHYQDLSDSQKIGINSAYGFLGAPGLNFNCTEAAAFITEKGREILLTAIHWATGVPPNEFMHLLNSEPEESE